MLWRVCAGVYLPAGVRGLPLQDELSERRRLQLVFVERHLIDHHGLRVQAGETDVRVRRAGGLEDQNVKDAWSNLPFYYLFVCFVDSLHKCLTEEKTPHNQYLT